MTNPSLSTIVRHHRSQARTFGQLAKDKKLSPGSKRIYANCSARHARMAQAVENVRDFLLKRGLTP